ncbi:ribbon-helix-helix domain-containing protein [Vibrio sp. T11.5]|uniref:ribbon-helix-helix domain-containing protein n=1 Tax=Vibrio sp. T11.5 TaxID=2998836 RepID=UPI0022CD8088|nr:ribbon-helix-helix domain-containing protein [Vibrio sp. T11.5]MDA0117034.1 ribbon-helix-helix domain-containing protein [Vibrio sp. T11.5]
MCEIFSNQPQENYQIIARSLRIDGHATSIKLEASFWQILEEIAQQQSMTLPRFISVIYSEALKYNREIKNFTSLLRCACLIYLRQPDDVMAAVKQQLITHQ